MSIENEEKNGKIYNDDPWPDGYDAIALMLKERDFWKNSNVTIFCDHPVLSYHDRSKLNNKTVKVSKYLNGVIYVLAPIGSKIKTVWNKKDRTISQDFDMGFTNESHTNFRDGLPFVYEKEIDNPECGDEITISEIFSDYRSHTAYTKGVELINFKDVILDLGAHIGTFARDAIAKNPKRIICVEAHQRNYRILCKNLNLANSNSTQIDTLFNAVVDDNTKGNVRLWVYPKNAFFAKSSKYRYAVSSIFHTRYKVPVSVKSKGFRALLDEYKPTILKIDTEGAECSWDFSNLPKEIRAIIIEVELKINVKNSSGKTINWYKDIFVENMKKGGFKKIEPQKDWGYTRDELWTRI